MCSFSKALAGLLVLLLLSTIHSPSFSSPCGVVHQYCTGVKSSATRERTTAGRHYKILGVKVTAGAWVLLQSHRLVKTTVGKREAE